MRKHFFEIKEGDMFCDKQGKLIVAVEDTRSPSDCLFVTTPEDFVCSQYEGAVVGNHDSVYYENFNGIGEFVDVKGNLGRAFV